MGETPSNLPKNLKSYFNNPTPQNKKSSLIVIFGNFLKKLKFLVK